MTEDSSSAEPATCPTGKFLIVKIGAIGDVALTIPAAHQLHLSGVQVYWLCGKSVLPLLNCYSWIKPIVVDEKRLLLREGTLNCFIELFATWRKLLPHKFECVALLQYDRKYRVITWPIRSKRKISLNRGSRRYSLISERHHSDEYARILNNWPDDCNPASLAPVPPESLPPSPLPRVGDRMRIAIVPGGAKNLINDDPQRRWPIDYYVSLARALNIKGFEVVLSGGPGDLDCSAAFENTCTRDFIGSLTLPQTVALYNSCDVVISHDTGPLHLAGLAHCAVIGLFGPTVPWKCLPRRNGVIGIWGGERLACRPCYDGRTFAPCTNNICMQSIAVERVLNAIDSIVTSQVREDWKIQVNPAS